MYSAFDLLSVSYALKNGFNLRNEGATSILTKSKITFDRILKIKTAATASIVSKKGSRNGITDLNNLSKTLGRCKEVNARLTAKSHGCDMMGHVETCKVCELGKARHKSTKNCWKGGSKPSSKTCCYYIFDLGVKDIKIFSI